MKLEKKRTKYYFIIPIIVVVIVALVMAICIIIAKNSQPSDDPAAVDETAEFDGEELTEEMIATTKKTLDETATVEILGFRQMEDDDGIHNAVGVRVTNSGDKTTSIAIEIAAKDAEGNILDKSSLYAEGINPGQVYDFNLFAFTTLTAEQLQTAKYEVYKASTYEAPTSTTE